MTPEKHTELNEQGYSVIKTSDLDAILLQLARLAQFERLMIEMGNLDESHRVRDCIEITRVRQEAPPYVKPDTNDMRPLAILDIPMIGIELHQALHEQLDKHVCINPVRVQAAISAFVGILRAEAI